MTVGSDLIPFNACTMHISIIIIIITKQEYRFYGYEWYGPDNPIVWTYSTKG